jgi:hypothetical protein
MNDMIAKPVVKNKFWVVEDEGNKIATIQAIDDGRVVYVHDEQRELFPSIKFLKKKYNIVFDRIKTIKVKSRTNEVYGYPTSSKPYNELYDVPRKLPVYTKSSKSKSYFCAGHYLIDCDGIWEKSFCPKLITLNRYSYQGPYTSEEQAQEQLRKINGKR